MFLVKCSQREPTGANVGQRVKSTGCLSLQVHKLIQPLPVAQQTLQPWLQQCERKQNVKRLWQRGRHFWRVSERPSASLWNFVMKSFGDCKARFSEFAGKYARANLWNSRVNRRTSSGPRFVNAESDAKLKGTKKISRNFLLLTQPSFSVDSDYRFRMNTSKDQQRWSHLLL